MIPISTYIYWSEYIGNSSWKLKFQCKNVCVRMRLGNKTKSITLKFKVFICLFNFKNVQQSRVFKKLVELHKFVVINFQWYIYEFYSEKRAKFFYQKFQLHIVIISLFLSLSKNYFQIPHKIRNILMRVSYDTRIHVCSTTTIRYKNVHYIFHWNIPWNLIKNLFRNMVFLWFSILEMSIFQNKLKEFYIEGRSIWFFGYFIWNFIIFAHSTCMISIKGVWYFDGKYICTNELNGTFSNSWQWIRVGSMIEFTMYKGAIQKLRYW